MDYSCFMGRRHRRRHLQHDRDGVRQIKWAILRQQALQCLALEQFHHEVDVTISRLAKISYAYRVYMTQAPCSFGFAPKSRLGRFVFNKALVQNFYRDQTIDKQVSSAINRAHTADAKLFFKQILLVEGAAEEWIDKRSRDIGGVGLQWRTILRTEFELLRVFPTACRA